MCVCIVLRVSIEYLRCVLIWVVRTQGYLISIRNLTKALDKLRREKQSHETDLQRRKAQKVRALEEVAIREQKILEYQQQVSYCVFYFVSIGECVCERETR